MNNRQLKTIIPISYNIELKCYIINDVISSKGRNEKFIIKFKYKSPVRRFNW